VESVPRDGNYQMVKMELSYAISGICKLDTGTVKCYLWNLYLEMRIIKWSSVESVRRDGNYSLLSLESVPRD
jgi:hypothetical protein